MRKDFSANELKATAWWSQPGSNRRPPACKAGALPTELWPRQADSRRLRLSRRSADQLLGALALRQVLVGVVAGADQGAGGDRLETEVVGGPLEIGELVGVPVADDGKVVLGRAQVLADGEDLDVVLAEEAEGLDHLLEGLAEADHQ